MTTNNTELGTNGSWLPLLKTGVQGDKEITTNDLDAIANKFGTGSTNKIPVSFGRPSAGGPVLGQIDAVETKGDTLHGRLSDVDPRLAQLLKAGMMKKRIASVSGHGTPQAALSGVGMIHRQYSKGTWSECPATEPQLNSLVAAAGNVDAHTSFSDDRSAIGISVEFCPARTTRSHIAIDSTSRQLDSLAKARAKERSISFGEALSQVASERSDLARPRQSNLVDANGVKLSTMAKDRAKEQGISFGEALSQVARERPELTIPHFEFREGR